MHHFSMDLAYYGEDKTFLGSRDDLPGWTIETCSFGKFLKEAMDRTLSHQ